MENKTVHFLLCSSLLFFVMTCKASTEMSQISSSEAPKDFTPQNFDIYLLIGQSNMAGRAEITSEVRDTLDNVYLFTGSNWQKAANPLNRYSNTRKSIDMQKLGPGYTFALTLSQNIDNEIGLVVNARGGTSIEQWQKEYTGDNDFNLYEHALERIERVNNDGTIKGIIWHQGESNQSRPSSYMESLIKLVRDFRNDLGMPELYFVAGQIGQWRNGSLQINKVIEQIPQQIDNAAYVVTDGLTPLNGDSTDPHFDSRSQKILGERYAQEVLNNVYN